MGTIHQFTDFNSFHRMANGGLVSRHEDVQVFRFEDLRPDTQATPLFKTNFYQIGLFNSVSFDVGYFGRTQTVDHKHVVVLFKPGQIVSFSKTRADAKGYALMFKEHFIDWRIDNMQTVRDFPILDPSINCVVFPGEEAFRDLTDIAAKMHQEYVNVLDAGALQILRLYSQILIGKISRLMVTVQSEQPMSHAFASTQRFKSLVFQHLHETKSVQDYAEMMHMTEKSLINHVKATEHLTPKDFINMVIVEESKAMLRNQVPVEEVAFYFNFTDTPHFSNFFRNKTGESPREFRKKR